MGFGIQVYTNHLLQRVPAISFVVKDHKYLFNIPEHHERFQKIFHLRRIKVPLFIFFTKASISTVGGILTYIAELHERNFGLQCRFFVHDKIYRYIALVVIVYLHLFRVV